MAEGVFRKLVEEERLREHIEIASAGMHAYQLGRPPDVRAQEAARRRGIDLGDLRGRQATHSDIERHDYVLAMDRENYEDLLDLCPDGCEHKIRLFMEFAPDRPEREVPDPYFGGPAGFDRVLDMIEEASAGLLADIRKRL